MDGGAGSGARLLIGCLAPFVCVRGLLLLLVFVGDWPPIEALGAKRSAEWTPALAHWSLVAVNVVSAWASAVLAARADHPAPARSQAGRDRA